MDNFCLPKHANTIFLDKLDLAVIRKSNFFFKNLPFTLYLKNSTPFPSFIFPPMPSLFSTAKQCEAIKNVISNHIVSLYNDIHVTEYNDQVINGIVNYTDFHLAMIIF